MRRAISSEPHPSVHRRAWRWREADEHRRTRETPTHTAKGARGTRGAIRGSCCGGGYFPIKSTTQHDTLESRRTASTICISNACILTNKKLTAHHDEVSYAEWTTDPPRPELDTAHGARRRTSNPNSPLRLPPHTSLVRPVSTPFIPQGPPHTLQTGRTSRSAQHQPRQPCTPSPAGPLAGACRQIRGHNELVICEPNRFVCGDGMLSSGLKGLLV